MNAVQKSQTLLVRRWLVACLGLVAVIAATWGAVRVAESLTAPHGGLIWADEFDGPAGAPPADHWRLLQGGGGWGNNELQTYSARPENVSLDGTGNLRITARREGDGSITSARIESRVAFTHGLVEARMRVPAGQGLWSAFWTLGEGHEQVGWPYSGEIDIVEALNDTRTAHANAHIADPASPDGRWQSPGGLDLTAPLSDRWHVFGVRWTRDALVFLLDGRPYHRIDRSEVGERDWPFDRPQVLLLNLAVGGDWPGSPDATTPFPASLLVDWVRVRPLKD